MLRKRTRTPITIAGFVGAAGLACSVATATPSLDFGIDDNTEYQAFLNAVKRAEYIRDDFLTGAIAIYDANGDVIGEAANPPGTKMSVIGTIAATIAFMERNPTALGGATEDFIEAFEAELESFRADDPYLNRPSNFLAAMKAARVTAVISANPEGLLGGFDTDVNDRALELLGVTLPEVTSRTAFDDRVEAHERALVSSLGTSTEFILLLTHALMNQDPDGSVRESDNTNQLRNYIRDDAGYESGWRQGTYPKPEINAAIGALPADFAAYQSAVAQSISTYDSALATYEAAEDALRDPITGEITDYDALETALEEYRASTSLSDNEFQQRIRQASYGVHDAIDEISSEISPDPLSLADSLALTESEYQAIALERRNDLRDTSGERTSISANAILMYQNIDNAAYAERQLNLGSATLGANKDWANAKAGTQLGLSVIGVGAAAASGDSLSAYGFASDAIMTSLDLADNNANSGPILDDVYIQIREVQHQIQAMQTQLNERFDIVEQKLDTVFETMVNGFDLLASGQLDIRAEIDAAIATIQENGSRLSTLEGTLIQVNGELIDLLFSQDLNGRVGVRFDGVDFPFNSGGGEDDFDSAASDFYTYAVNNADDAVYTGNPANVTADITAYLASADENFTDATASSRINELIALSPAFLTGGSTALVPSSVVSPEAWSMASTAYLQLADESPWYFARDFSGQGSTRLDEIIAKGNDLIALAQAFRQTELDNGEEVPTLFKELVANYKAKVDGLQAHIDDSITRYLARDITVGERIVDVPLSNDQQTLDLWLDDTVVGTTNLADRLSRYKADQSFAENLSLPDSNQEGFRSVTGFETRPNGEFEGDMARRAQLHSLLQAATNGGVSREAIWYLEDSPFDARVDFYVELEKTAGGHSRGDAEQHRYLQIQRQVRNRRESGGWTDWRNNGFNTLGNWADRIDDLWGQIDDEIITGEHPNPPYEIARGIEPPPGNTTATQDRLRVMVDVCDGQSTTVVNNKILTLLTGIRGMVRDEIFDDMLDGRTNSFEGNTLADRLAELDDAEAILDAYVAIAFPAALEDSTLLRSALRGVAGSEVGLRGDDVLELMDRFFEKDNESFTDLGDPTFDLPAIADLLNDRIDLVYEELIAALDTPVQAAPYAETVLAELKTLRDTHNALAVPDIFESQIEGAVRSVLANDTRQVRTYDENGVPDFRPIEIDMTFADGDEGYLAPANGTLEMFADGTFVYTPDAGFTGEDYFTYRVRCDVAPENGAPNYATSAPAIVRIRTLDCPLDIVGTGDSLGEDINAFDIRAYIGDRTSMPSITGIVDAAIANDCQ